MKKYLPSSSSFIVCTALFAALWSHPVLSAGANPPPPSASDVLTKPAFEEPAALYASGLKYFNGTGAAKDENRALELFRRAAERGYADAIGMVGYYYSAGLVVEKDDQTARRHFAEAADKGSVDAQLNLGICLLFGRGGEKDPPRAVASIEKAIAQGSMKARLMLGEIYLFGDHAAGTPDHQRAHEVLISAAESGNPRAQNMIGVIVRDGGTGKPDPAGARTWFEKAAQQGDAKACSNLGHLLGHGIGNLLGSDPKDRELRIEALKWLMVAEALNELTAEKYLEDIRGVRSADELEAARKLANEVVVSLPKSR